jgi:hypothetical protein
LGEVDRVAVRVLDVGDPLAPRHVVRRTLHEAAELDDVGEERVDVGDVDAQQHPLRSGGGVAVGDDAQVGVADAQADEEGRPLCGDALGLHGADQRPIEAGQPLEVAADEDGLDVAGHRSSARGGFPVQTARGRRTHR